MSEYTVNHTIVVTMKTKWWTSEYIQISHLRFLLTGREKEKIKSKFQGSHVVRLQSLSIFTCQPPVRNEETQSRQWIDVNAKTGALAPIRPSSIVLNSTTFPEARFIRTCLNSWLAIKIISMAVSSAIPSKILAAVTSKRELSKRLMWRVLLARALICHSSSSSFIWSSKRCEAVADAELSA